MAALCVVLCIVLCVLYICCVVCCALYCVVYMLCCVLCFALCVVSETPKDRSGRGSPRIVTDCELLLAQCSSVCNKRSPS